MQQIDLDGVRYNLPERWKDVDLERLPRLIELIFLTPESGKMYHALIQLALNIRPKVWRKLHQAHFSERLSETVKRKNAEVLHLLLQQLSWLFTEPMDQQPFESLQVGKEAWLLPEPEFVTMSYGEMTDLYVHLNGFIQQQPAGDERLDYLVATACRPRRAQGYTTDPDWNGDHREVYNEFIVRDRVATVSGLDFSLKMAVLLYVASTFKDVLSRYVLFDRPSVSDATTVGIPDETGEAYIGQGFIRNQHLLAEKGIFGTMKQTQAANAHEVLLFLEEHRADMIVRQRAAEAERQ
ncbi:hypothetical protein [uncultured Fibrella sp.]|uniref:hypothetical protein n=1 Tax=uncultured Fibrella sp. TaxID=1284596 RepID=UPI0035CC283D